MSENIKNTEREADATELTETGLDQIAGGKAGAVRDMGDQIAIPPPPPSKAGGTRL